MKKGQLNARQLMFGLYGLIAVLIVAVGFGFYYAENFLSAAVADTNDLKDQANVAQQNVVKLQQLQSELTKQADVVQRTEQIMADSQQYQYQDQIVKDINTYAARTGVKVIGYDFGDPTKKAANKTSLPSVSGTQIITADLTLDAPVKYTHFLNFLQAIEQNLTKMQVTGVNITPDDQDADYVSNPGISLQIYVKN
ncbi:MAG TPA: hypothetical protein VFL81_02040 [Candidatus Saccharimonadales bacterium]|nr:hypothetical protein [Candidatus Saccharimonadales bacterium]